MIPVYRPTLGQRERTLLLKAFDSGWISGSGEFVDLFEERFAASVGARHAIAVNNGTSALHVALAALDLGPGDEVVLPALTYVACANAVAHLGAIPVLAESSEETWQADLDSVIHGITPRTRAVLIPHLFGFPVDLSAIAAELALQGIVLIEDCSEALGSLVGGAHVGGLGAVATYSFFGNKTITTGEGGMVTTNDDATADLIRRLRNQGVSRDSTYFHDLRGFNFRMPNLQAAIGVAQLDRLDEFVERKRAIAKEYRDGLPGLRFLDDPPGGRNSHWLSVAALPEGVDREGLIAETRSAGVDVRPGFVPMYLLPMYRESESGFPRTERFHRRLVCLPSFPGLSDGEVRTIIDVVGRAAVVLAA